MLPYPSGYPPDNGKTSLTFLSMTDASFLTMTDASFLSMTEVHILPFAL
ncbi:hypothetical protein [Dulcicalothrix desertica]|nr:hypothetical protein [Dulcicalothrix desertica]